MTNARSKTSDATVPAQDYADMLVSAKKTFLTAMKKYCNYLMWKEEVESSGEENDGCYNENGTVPAESGAGENDGILDVSTIKDFEPLDTEGQADVLYGESEKYFRKSVNECWKSVREYRKRVEASAVKKAEHWTFLRDSGDLTYAQAVVKMETAAYNDAKSLFDEAVESYKDYVKIETQKNSGEVKNKNMDKIRRRLGNAYYELAAIAMYNSLDDEADKSFEKAVREYEIIDEEGKTDGDRRCLGNALFERGRLKAEEYLSRKECDDNVYRTAIKDEISNGSNALNSDIDLKCELTGTAASEELKLRGDKELLDRLFKDDDKWKTEITDLFNKAIEKYESISEKWIEEDNYVDVYCSWGEIHSLFGRLYRYKYLTALRQLKDMEKKNISEKKTDSEKIKDLRKHFKESVAEAKKHFEEAVKILRKGKNLDDKNRESTEMWSILGGAYYRLYLTYRLGGEKYKSKCDEMWENADVLFKNSKTTILEILVVLNIDVAYPLIKGEALYSLLENEKNEDTLFFNDIVSKDDKERNGYKKIYIHSMYIISRLEVKNDNGKLVAHYTRKSVAQGMLLNNKKMAMYASEYLNDPDEGKLLLNYLFDCNWDAKKKDEKDNLEEKHKDNKEMLLKLEQEEYIAFTGSFSFDYDSLNQFRLYGKDDGREGTGVAMVFNKSFFRVELKQDRAGSLEDIEENECGIVDTKKQNWWKDFKNLLEESSRNRRQNTLFRCAYFDPETDRVVAVGKKERYLFYRDCEKKTKENRKNVYEKEIKDIEARHAGYKKFIDAIVDDINVELAELQKEVEFLEPLDVAKLTLKLRFLIKNVAFRQEQECRIVKRSKLVGSRGAVDSRGEGGEILIGSGGTKSIGEVKMHIEYGMDVPQHVNRVCFGPKADGMDVFRKCLVNKGLDKIKCEKSSTHLA